VLIRRLTPTDIDTLRAIRLEALRTDPDAFGSTLEREKGRSDDDWRAWLGRGATFVADDDGEPSGLVVALTPDNPSTVALLAMFVSSRARRSGVGQALVEAAVEWAASTQAERVVLMVIEGNTPAISLYESCGFTFTGARQSRDRDGATELEMVRVIRTER
jgi:ribosomal protein S18 acetylase RimI-like enzyme